MTEKEAHRSVWWPFPCPLCSGTFLHQKNCKNKGKHFLRIRVFPNHSPWVEDQLFLNKEAREGLEIIYAE